MDAPDPKLRIAQRALLELHAGDVVNLGIGIPTLVADLLCPEQGVHLHSENGILGVGPRPAPDQVDPDLVNAAKQPVTLLEGGSFFDSASSFAMIRGGHVDVALLGALQVDEQGNLANWLVPGKPILGVGGAMDLAAGARRVVVLTNHTNEGVPKLVRELTLPLTAARCVETIITELAVFRFRAGRMLLCEVASDSSLDEVARLTEARYEVAPDLASFGGREPAAAGA